MRIDWRNSLPAYIPAFVCIISGVHLIVNLVQIRLLYNSMETYEHTMQVISIQPDIYIIYVVGTAIFDFAWLIFGIIIWVNRDKRTE